MFLFAWNFLEVDRGGLTVKWQAVNLVIYVFRLGLVLNSLVCPTENHSL